MRTVKFLLTIIIDDIRNAEVIRDALPGIGAMGFDGILLSPRRITDSAELDEIITVLDMLILSARALGLGAWVECAGGSPAEFGAAVSARFRSADGRTIIGSSASPFYEVCTLQHISDIYERIKNGLSPDAFEYLTGFCGVFDGFAGPPGTVPWYDGIDEEFLTDYGMDINMFIGSLFDDTDSRSNVKARYRYKLAVRAAEASAAPIGAWCRNNGKLYIPRLRSARLLDRVELYGSGLRINSEAELPSVTVGCAEDFSPFLASAASRGTGDAAAFLFAETGADLSPGELEDLAQGLTRCGINIFIFDSFVPGASPRILRENRLSFSPGLSWSGALPYIFDKIRSSFADEQARLLLICPSCAVWSRYTPGGENRAAAELIASLEDICGRLFDMGRRFYVTDEALLESTATFDDDGIRLGGAAYRTVLIVPGCLFTKKGRLMIEKARANGVRILDDIPKSDAGIIPPEFIRSRLREIIPVAAWQDSWTVTPPSSNMLPLEMRRSGDAIEGSFTAAGSPAGTVELVVAGGGRGTVSINGVVAPEIRSDENGVYYDISPGIVTGINKAAVIGGFTGAAVCLRGDFRVTCSGDGYVLSPPDGEMGADLTKCGYPFALAPACAKKIIYIEENISRPKIKLDTAGASVTEVIFDGISVGFVYGGRDMLELPPMAPEERHVIEIRRFPPVHSIGRGQQGCGKVPEFNIPENIELIREF